MANISELKAQRQADAATFKNLSGKEAQHLFKTDRAQYETLRAAAQALGVIGPNGYRAPGLRISHVVDVPEPRTTAEIKARIRWPEAEVRKFYDSGNENPNYSLSLTDKHFYKNHTHDDYTSLREAAMSYGIIPRSETRPQNAPANAQPSGSENPIILGERLAKITGLPASTEISADQLFELNEHVNALDREKVK